MSAKVGLRHPCCGVCGDPVALRRTGRRITTHTGRTWFRMAYRHTSKQQQEQCGNPVGVCESDAYQEACKVVVIDLDELRRGMGRSA